MPSFSGSILDYLRLFGTPLFIFIISAVIVAAINHRSFYPLIPPARVKPTSIVYKGAMWLSFIAAAVASPTLLGLGYLLAWVIFFFAKGVFHMRLSLKRSRHAPPLLLLLIL